MAGDAELPAGEVLDSNVVMMAYFHTHTVGGGDAFVFGPHEVRYLVLRASLIVFAVVVWTIARRLQRRK